MLVTRLSSALGTVLGFACASAALAQGKVWVVDAASGAGAHFTDIAPAVAAAAEHDTLLVRSGVYAPFTVFAKSLTITSDAGATVQLGGGFSVRALAANQTVLVRGIATAPGIEHGFLAKNDAGYVQLEHCEFVTGPQHGDGARIDHCSAVALNHCTSVGDTGTPLGAAGATGGAGIHAILSNLYLYDSALIGGKGTFGDDLGGPGGAGAYTEGGFLFTAGCEFFGGTGGPADSDPDDPPFGSGCGVPGTGGSGISTVGLWSPSGTSPSLVVVLDGAFVPGQGGFNYDETCWSAGPGSPIEAPALYGGFAQVLNGSAHSYRITSPVREQHSATVSIEGTTGSLAVVLVAGLPANAYFVDFGGVVLAAPPLNVLPLGAIPGSGSLTANLAVPAQAPGVEAVVVHTQSVLVAPTLAIQLGPPAALVILDQSF